MVLHYKPKRKLNNMKSKGQGKHLCLGLILKLDLHVHRHWLRLNLQKPLSFVMLHSCANNLCPHQHFTHFKTTPKLQNNGCISCWQMTKLPHRQHLIRSDKSFRSSTNHYFMFVTTADEMSINTGCSCAVWWVISRFQTYDHRESSAPPCEQPPLRVRALYSLF